VRQWRLSAAFFPSQLPFVLGLLVQAFLDLLLAPAVAKIATGGSAHGFDLSLF
jgi:hypothetical protein